MPMDWKCWIWRCGDCDVVFASNKQNTVVKDLPLRLDFESCPNCGKRGPIHGNIMLLGIGTIELQEYGIGMLQRGHTAQDV